MMKPNGQLKKKNIHEQIKETLLGKILESKNSCSHSCDSPYDSEADTYAKIAETNESLYATIVNESNKTEKEKV